MSTLSKTRKHHVRRQLRLRLRREPMRKYLHNGPPYIQGLHEFCLRQVHARLELDSHDLQNLPPVRCAGWGICALTAHPTREPALALSVGHPNELCRPTQM